MRVITTYANGTLLGISTQGGIISYKVLIDGIQSFQSEIIEEGLQMDDEILNGNKIERRIYHCLSIKVLSEEGQEVEFSDIIYKKST